MSFLDSAADFLRDLPAWQQKVLLFLIVLIGGGILVRLIVKAVDRAIYKIPQLDRTMRRFLDTMTEAVGWTVLVVILLSIAGVDPAALAGGLALGGFVIGFALKDTLGNLAAGVMLLAYRPFNVGDTVTLAGETGEVQELGMSMTRIKLGDGRLVMIPNGKILGDKTVNHTREPIRRADVNVGIAYDADIDNAVRAILEALGKDERVLKEPAPIVRITQLADSSVNLQVRPWVSTAVYWQAQADFHGVVKRALDGAGIGIPYPTREVRMVGGA